MRAVLTVERYAPAIGGAERVVQRVAEGLAARGHEVTVITGGPRSREELGGVRVERLPLRGNEHAGIRGDVAAVGELIRMGKPDVVLNYAAQSWPTDACFPLLDDPDRPAMVMAPCGFSALHAPAWRGYFARLRELLPRYDALIFHSATYRDWDFAAAAGAERMEVIPNGADPLPTTEREAGEPALVTVGSHVRSKGHADFIRVVSQLRGEGRAVRGRIVAPPRRGLDSLRGCQLRCSLAGMRPGGGIEVVDGTPRRATEEAIASAAALLLPSAIECSPLVLIEAMSAGVPWVSYDAGNARELAGGIVAGDREGMATAAREILEGEHAELGVEGRRAWEEGHRWEQLVPRYERVLSDAAERARKARSERLATRSE